MEGERLSGRAFLAVDRVSRSQSGEEGSQGA